jgi:hypothetical protein
MIGILGKEKVNRLLATRLLEVENKLRYVIEVMQDPKEKTITTKVPEPFVPYFELMKEIGNEVPDRLRERFAELIGKEEVIAKLEIPPELVARVKAGSSINHIEFTQLTLFGPERLWKPGWDCREMIGLRALF